MDNWNYPEGADGPNAPWNQPEPIDCPHCNGLGTITDEDEVSECSQCEGTGYCDPRMIEEDDYDADYERDKRIDDEMTGDL